MNDDNAGTVNFQCDESASPPPPPAPVVPPPGDLAKYYIHPFIYHTHKSFLLQNDFKVTKNILITLSDHTINNDETESCLLPSV